MLRRLTVVLATLLTAAAVACARETADVLTLQRALRQEYPGAQFEVGFINGPHHLRLLVDSAVWRDYQLPTSELRPYQRMARFVLEQYGAAADLDSITIDFLTERSGVFFWKSLSFNRERFAAADLR